MARVRVSRWWLVVFGASVMGMAGLYQFGWSSFRAPLGARIGAGETALGSVFTAFVVTQTLSQFPVGHFRDRYGPRLPLLAGGAVMTVGFAGTAIADSVPMALGFYAIGGLGVGAVYSVAVNTPVKWFDDRRGLAAGVVGASYGSVSFLLIPTVRRGAQDAFAETLLAAGALAGITALVAAVFLRDPPDYTDDLTPAHTGGGDPDDRPGADDGPVPVEDDRAYTWRDAVRTWQFWLLYFVFVVINGVGLMVIGKVVSFADALTLPAGAATASASAVALADASGVLVGGGLSDVLGRARTVAWMLVCAGLSLFGAVLAGDAGITIGFVVLVAATAFFRSPAFAVFPSIVGDYYGPTHSSQNYAVLYTAKLWGGIAGGVAASALIVSLGWSESFLIGAGLLVLAGVAVTFLRPVEAEP